MDNNEPISVPVNQTDENYRMDHEKRGYALIFSHENFESNLELDPRPESKKSAEQLKIALEKLKFEVEIFTDKKLCEIKAKVNERKQNYFIMEWKKIIFLLNM
jgi:hypothetical protein